MEHSARVIYHSETVTIGEITGEQTQHGETLEHSLEQGSVVFVQSGIFGKSPNDCDVIVDANYVLLGRGGDRLYPLRTSKEPYACMVIRYAARVFGDLGQAQPACALSTAQTHLMQAHLLNDLRLGRSGRPIESGAIALLRDVTATMHAAVLMKHEHMHTVRVIKEMLNQSLSKPPSLADVARRLYLSPFTVSRIFHSETGISLRRYIRRLRLRKALHVMLSRPVRLANIAIELGFYDEPHFSKAFSAEFGTSPRACVNIGSSPLFAAPTNQD